MATDVRQSSELLNSWKEISNYVGRGIRTVQRWETEFGLPVRRPAGHVRGSVIAMRKEIDEWLCSRSARQAVESTPVEAASHPQFSDKHAHQTGKVEELTARCAALLEENKSLRENLARTRVLIQALREELFERGVTPSASRILEIAREMPGSCPPSESSVS